MINKTKRRIFDVIQIGQETDLVSRLFDYLIILVIIANIACMFLETFDELAPWYDLMRGIEYVTLLFFIFEYVLRIWTAEYLYPTGTKKMAILKFLVSFDGVVDLLTILPFFFLSGFVVFRMLRVVRILHLFRINANYDSFNVIWTVLYEKRNQIASSVFIVIVLLCASSLGMYSAEHEAQPDVFKNVFSGIWWATSTLLTVGYGDIYPVTVIGKCMGILTAFLGVGVVAIPTGIISAGFVEQYTKAANANGGLEVNIQTVIVDIDSRWIGLTADEIRRKDDVVVVLVKRNTVVMQPGSDYLVEVGDAMAVYRDVK